jgi:hypothetical protein
MVGMRDPGPKRSPAGRRHVVPEAAVLVVGDDHQHVLPLRAGAQLVEQAGDVRVAGHDVGVAGCCVFTPAGL